jgi:hypothetical protein
MSNLSTVFDTVLGLFFVFLLLSLIATWVQEFIAGIADLRAKGLLNGVQNLLNPPSKANQKLDGIAELKKAWSAGVSSDETENLKAKLKENAVKTLYEHPLIKSLAQPRGNPSYISSREFANTLLDILITAGTEESTPKEILKRIEDGIKQISNPSTKDALAALVKIASESTTAAENKIAAVRDSIAQWFDGSMDRASGWYKRQAQKLAVVIGIGVAIAFNADTVAISNSLWHDTALRESLANAATAYINKGEEDNATNARTQLAELGLPIGWSFQLDDSDPVTPPDPQKIPGTPQDWLSKIAGILVTGLAISQGAPIWFDLLGHLVNMRQAGKKPQPDDGS